MAQPRCFLRELCKSKNDFVGYCLNGSGDVHVKLGEQIGLRAPYRMPEQGREFIARHAQTCTVVKIRQVQVKAAVRFQVNQLIKDNTHVFRLAIGRKAHELVLAGVDLETGVIRECRIEETKRVREMDLSENFEM